MNNSHILMIIFIFHFSYISSPPERGRSNSNNNDLDATLCNYGKHRGRMFRWCDCRNVLGKGSHCKIEKMFNSTHGQVILATVPDHLDSWKKNLVTQFPNEKITIVVETNYDVKGFVDNNIYFHLHLLPNVSETNYILTLRSNFEMIEEIFSKKNNNEDVSNKEKMNKCNETSKTNETKVVKNDYIHYYITWSLLAVGLALVMLGFIKLFLNIINKFTTKNRLRSNTDEHGFLDVLGNQNAVVTGKSNIESKHNECEELEFVDVSGNPNTLVTEKSNIENEEHNKCEELEFVDVSGNPNAVVTGRSGQAFLDIQKDDENNDIQTSGSSSNSNHDLSGQAFLDVQKNNENNDIQIVNHSTF